MIGNYVITYNPKATKVIGKAIKKALRKPRKKTLCDHPRRASKSVKILDLLESKPVGMTSTQVRQALWEMTYDPAENPFDKKSTGYWSTNLFGSDVRRGLLTFFAVKKGRRWFRNSVPHDGHPWQVMDKAAGFKHNTRSKYLSNQGNWSVITATGTTYASVNP